MASSDRIVSLVPLFDGNNFPNWKFRMLTVLDDLGLVQCVEDTFWKGFTEAKEDEKQKRLKQDKRCRTTIVMRVADSHLEYCKDKDTACEMWESLIKTFERKGISSQLLLRKKLLTMKLDSQKDLKTHFLDFDNTIRDLKMTGAQLNELDVVCHLLLTMTKEYNNVVTAIETINDTSTVTLSFVKNRLLEEESKKKEESSSASGFDQPDHAFSVRGRGRGFIRRGFRGRGGPSRPLSDVRCYSCNGRGHISTNCYKNNSKKNERSNAVSFVAANVNDYEMDFNKDKISFILDSGASSHFINEKYTHVLKNVRDVPETSVTLASGDVMTVKRQGDLHLDDVCIKNILIAPFKYNLLSVGKMEESQLSITFNNKRAVVKTKDNKIVLCAENNKSLYFVNFDLRNTTNVLLSKTTSASLWHQRLGHPSNRSEKQICKLMGKRFEKSSCDHCIEAKQTKVPHVRERIRAQRSLQLIHSDVLVVNQADYQGRRYVVTFIDDYTHFTVVYVIHNKSEVLDCFKDYKAYAENHFERKISRLRCDNGGEYTSSRFKQFAQQSGIRIEYTMAYNSVQNGVAERMNRTLVEKARCLLFHSNMDKQYWSEAIYCAAYLVNRSPTSALQSTVPAAMWFRHPVNYDKLRVFGCAAYLRYAKPGGKFQPRSRKLVFVGYTPNGYKLLDVQSGKILHGCDVVFKEDSFPFSVADVPVPNAMGHTDDEDSYGEEDSGNGDSESSDTKSRAVKDKSVSEEVKSENKSRAVKSVSEMEEGSSESETEEEDGTQIPVQQEIPVTTRSGRVVQKPEYLGEYVQFALNVSVPETFDDIQGRDDEDEWRSAVDDELKALNDANTWSVCNKSEKPVAKKCISTKWVFRVKDNGKYKARLVARGCSQREEDYGETYAPVARVATIRTILAVAFHFHYVIETMDVKNAYLHGSLTDEVYISVPPGVTLGKEKCLKLNKALYGLRQAPRVWNQRMNSFLLSNQFKRSCHDQCLYVKNGKKPVYFLLYVDDCLLVGDKGEIEKLKLLLQSEFNMTDLGEIKKFCGIEVNIDFDRDEMYLNQNSFIQKVLERFQMNACKPVATPWEKCKDTDDDTVFEDKLKYREAIGSLMYLMSTRPDICASVRYLSQFCENPLKKHWVAIKRIFRYLKGTSNFSLVYKRNGNAAPITAYADSDFANGEDRKSVSGNIVELFDNPIIWVSKKQGIVSLSTTESEFVSLCGCAQEILWLKGILKDLAVECNEPIVIYEDNQSTIALLKKWEHKRTKHVDVKFHFIKDLVENNTIDVMYIPSNAQKADILTKPLLRNAFCHLRGKVQVLPVQPSRFNLLSVEGECWKFTA